MNGIINAHILQVDSKKSADGKKTYRTVTIVNKETFDKLELFLVPNAEVPLIDKNKLYKIKVQISKEGFKTNVSCLSFE